MKNLLFCFGTRPEAIKLAPVIQEAKKNNYAVKTIISGQHKEMLTPFLNFFNLTVDYNLDVLKPNQSLSELTASILNKIQPILKQERPDLLFVQGDTTTTFASTLAAFYEKIPVAHVEAGLRTHDRYSPFPEEINRALVGKIAEYHFAPTPVAKKNLEREGFSHQIHVTGNTGVDALRITTELLTQAGKIIKTEARSVLITCHRRENHGKPLENICEAIAQLSKNFPTVRFIFPVHLNPNVQSVVQSKLGSLPQVELLPPLGYEDFVIKMAECTLLLTDSGGVQEEAPFFKKPIFVLRESTERQEGVDAGVAELVGSNAQTIVAAVRRALTDTSYYSSFQKSVNPYGDGYASKKIFDILKQA